MANPILLDIPFDETPGSAVAQDYGPSDLNAVITAGQFVEGRAHRAVYFPDAGYAQIVGHQPFPLTGTWTLSVWIKAEITATGPHYTQVIFHFGQNRDIVLDLQSPLTVWSYVVIMQDSSLVSAYVNATLRDSETIPAGWGKPTGWVMLNDNPGGMAGYGSVEDLTLYQGIKNDEIGTDPGEPGTNPGNGASNMDLNYYVGGVNFTSFGVRVMASEGMIENLDLKESLEMDWPGYHGKQIDLSNPRYDVRTITLDCLIYATSSGDFFDKARAFVNAFQRQGTVRLMLIINTKVLVYEVFVPKGYTIKKKWSDSTMIGTFPLTLIEPEPVKRVLKYSGTGTASISLTSPKIVNIYWGDDSKTKDVYGTNVTRTHNYTSGSDHYIIVTGVIEDITSFSSNATTVWSKI